MCGLHLTWHYVGDETAAGTTCSVSRFHGQLARLRGEGYEVLTMGDVVGRMSSGAPLPPKYATLSFDDGLRDGYETVVPVLHEYGFTGTFHVITDTLEGKVPGVIALQALIKRVGAVEVEHTILPRILPEPFRSLLDSERLDIGSWYGNETKEFRRIKTVMNMLMPHYLKEELVKQAWCEFVSEDEYQALHRKLFIGEQELSAMANAGMEITSHTCSHPKFATLSLREIRDECIRSRQMLVEHLDINTAVLCYPFGDTITTRIMDTVREAGYIGACNYSFGQDPGDAADSRYNIVRVDEKTFDPV